MATDHIISLLASSSSLLYALRVLRCHGLGKQSLKDVLYATVIGKLTYCAPAWHGFCSTADYVRLESFLHRCVKLRYVERSATVTGMFLEADDGVRVITPKTHRRPENMPKSPQNVCI